MDNFLLCHGFQLASDQEEDKIIVCELKKNCPTIVVGPGLQVSDLPTSGFAWFLLLGLELELFGVDCFSKHPRKCTDRTKTYIEIAKGNWHFVLSQDWHVGNWECVKGRRIRVFRLIYTDTHCRIPKSHEGGAKSTKHVSHR